MNRPISPTAVMAVVSTPTLRSRPSCRVGISSTSTPPMMDSIWIAPNTRDRS